MIIEGHRSALLQKGVRFSHTSIMMLGDQMAKPLYGFSRAGPYGDID
jgi:hypothetical protein